MQNLRPIVAQCYRGARSIGNGQSRDFSSLNTKIELKGARAKARAFSNGILFCGVSVGFGCMGYSFWSSISRLELQSQRANARVTQVSNTANSGEEKEE